MTRAVKRIAVVPGDGIGPEVIAEAVAVLERLRETHGVRLELKQFDWGAEKFLDRKTTRRSSDLVVPGDGIGPEVIAEAVAVLERLLETHGVRLELKQFDWGAEKF